MLGLKLIRTLNIMWTVLRYSGYSHNTISVASCGRREGEISLVVGSSSASNDRINFAGMGENVISFKSNGGASNEERTMGSGTSFAASHVTGFIAALMDKKKEKKNEEKSFYEELNETETGIGMESLVQLLKQHVIDVEEEGKDNATGDGFLTYLSRTEFEEVMSRKAMEELQERNEENSGYQQIDSPYSYSISPEEELPGSYFPGEQQIDSISPIEQILPQEELPGYEQISPEERLSGSFYSYGIYTIYVSLTDSIDVSLREGEGFTTSYFKNYNILVNASKPDEDPVDYANTIILNSFDDDITRDGNSVRTRDGNSVIQRPPNVENEPS